MSPKILVFAGSARRDSLNKLLAAAAATRARESGGDVTLLDLNDYPMPLYHGDLESREGVPDAANKLRKLFIEHHALLIATPENNASVPAMLKNTLDWISRPHSGQNGTVPYQNKVAALMAASPGALGGMRVLVHLRQILQVLNVLVLSEQLAVPRAHELLEPPGVLKDIKLDASLRGLVDRLIDVTRRINA
jgi:chromate reductase